MKLLLIGFGVVGQALAKLLAAQSGEIYRRHGLAARLVGAIDSKGAALAPRGLDVADLLRARELSGTVAASEHGRRTTDALSILADAEADVVIEATPSDIRRPHAAIEHIKAAFRLGRHVITVNKGPLAVAMPALLELARYNRVEFRFSGTVGGGTPMLALAREAARGDEIVAVRAILNGTTNFILSRMHAEGESFDAALAEAVRLGYAETDPSNDIDGIDTATKVVILANWVLGRPTTIEDAGIAGIRGLPGERIAQAAARGQRVKLIGEIDSAGVRVGPQEVAAGGPLDVPANLNAMTLMLRSCGEVTLTGRGAGGVETATAILRDMLDIWHQAKDESEPVTGRK
jgi:homoserine dehydrogenase